MADKMMRIAGRANDGTAKAIYVNRDGSLRATNTGNLTGTHNEYRFGDLQSEMTETFVEVQKEAIIHTLHFIFDRDDSGVSAFFDLWNGQNLADGSHFKAYRILTSAESVTGAIRPGNLENDSLFIENGMNIYLQEPLHIKGFRIRLGNNLSETVKLGCNIVWSEV